MNGCHGHGKVMDSLVFLKIWNLLEKAVEFRLNADWSWKSNGIWQAGPTLPYKLALQCSGLGISQFHLGKAIEKSWNLVVEMSWQPWIDWKPFPQLPELLVNLVLHDIQPFQETWITVFYLIRAQGTLAKSDLIWWGCRWDSELSNRRFGLKIGQLLRISCQMWSDLIAFRIPQTMEAPLLEWCPY